MLHACEQGWSYIAEWTGVRLGRVLDLAGVRPESRYVVFEPFANPNQSRTVVRALWESIDMADALHPQTLLAYGLNGEALHPRLDQIGAKLVEEQKPDHEHDKAAQIEDDDAPGERRRKPRRQKSPRDARAHAQPTKFPTGSLIRKAMLNLRFGAHFSSRAAYPSLNR